MQSAYTIVQFGPVDSVNVLAFPPGPCTVFCMLLIGANWSDICKAPLAIGMGTRSFGEAWAFRDGTDSENLSKDESYLACEDFFKEPSKLWTAPLLARRPRHTDMRLGTVPGTWQ